MQSPNPKFWELEEVPGKGDSHNGGVHSLPKVHRRTIEGRFVAPLPERSDAPCIGESRSQAVERLCSLDSLFNTRALPKWKRLLGSWTHRDKVLHAHPCGP